MAGRVQDKVALITGAARGQGRSHAVRLAQEGADIIAIDICAPIESVPYPLGTSDELAETVRQVEELGRKILAVEADVRDADAVRAAVDQGVKQFGRLDIVSSNAGIGTSAQIGAMPEQMWRDMIDVNLTGAFHVTQAAIPHLIAGGRGGSIIITGSSTALNPVQNLGHYVAAKHGLVGLMRVLALELGEHNIRVNCIHPTVVDTNMIHNQSTYSLFLPEELHPTRDQVAEIYTSLNVLPMPWVQPIDISNGVLFLASDEGRYVTGIELPIDSGFAIK